MGNCNFFSILSHTQCSKTFRPGPTDPMQHPNASLILAPLTQMKEKLNQGVGGRQLDRPVAAISHFYLHLFWLKTQQIS